MSDEDLEAAYLASLYAKLETADAALEEARAALAPLQEASRELRRKIGMITGEGSPASKRGDRDMPGQIIAFLMEQPDQEARYEQILQGLMAADPLTAEGSVSSQINRMMNDGRLERPSRGLYRLP